MDRIEEGLHAHHAQLHTTHIAAPAPSSEGPSPPFGFSQNEISFATVNSVIGGSPASEAGLRAGDQIIRFGSVNASNHDKLGRVATEVQSNEGVSRFAGNIVFRPY